MDDREYEILKKFSKGAFVDDEDRYIVDRFANIGLIKFGYDTNKKGEIQETASLTPLGYDFYDAETRWRRAQMNSLERALYDFRKFKENCKERFSRLLNYFRYDF